MGCTPRTTTPSSPTSTCSHERAGPAHHSRLSAGRREVRGAAAGQRDPEAASAFFAAELAGDELVAAWPGSARRLRRTQHLVGSILIDDLTAQEARLRCYASVTHVLHAGHGESIWTAAGHHDAVLRSDDTQVVADGADLAPR